MRFLILVGLMLATLCQPGAFAQQSFGYGFLGGAFGGSHNGLDGAFRYGVGGEGYVAPHFTLGGEIGGIAKNGTGVLASGNVAFHIPARELDPFVTGGLSIGHKGGATGLYTNLGGGVNYWLRRNFGVRAEFRGYPGGLDLGSFAEFRMGVVFR